MPDPAIATYLHDALKGGYDSHSEDRLSQVFAASFNHSALFRKAFYAFADIPPLAFPNARTQLCDKLNGTQGRLDVCLYDRNTRKVIIENKIDAPLYVNQLTKYSRLHSSALVKKIALVKTFFEPFADNKGWKILHWGDLYRKVAEGKQVIDAGSTDGFVIDNFLSHLEEIGLKTVTRITSAELVGLAKAVHRMRSPKKCNFSLKMPAFEVAQRYISMLENIVEMTKEEPIIRKSVKKNYRFNPWFGGWQEGDDRVDRMHFMIGADINLSRHRRHRVRTVGTAILFYDKKPAKCSIKTYWQGKEDTYFRNAETYKGKDLVFDSYAKQVISLWRRWLKKTR